jgi:hypothetical protein
MIKISHVIGVTKLVMFDNESSSSHLSTILPKGGFIKKKSLVSFPSSLEQLIVLVII